MNQKRKKENDNEYISAVVHGRDMARISKQMTLINFVDHHYVIIILFDCNTQNNNSLRYPVAKIHTLKNNSSQNTIKISEFWSDYADLINLPIACFV